MKTIPVLSGLNPISKNIVGKISLQDEYINKLNKQIEGFLKTGILPKVEISYSFQDGEIKSIDLRFISKEASP